MQSSGKIKDVKKKSMSERGRCFSIKRKTLSGPVAVEEEKKPQKIQRQKKKSKRMSETPQGTWFDRAQKSSLWPCYA